MKRSSSRAVAALGLLIASVVFSPERALGQFILTRSPSIRSWGMGQLGAADDIDPANAFFNPAIISLAQGAFVTGGYEKFPAFLDLRIYNVGAGGAMEISSREGVRWRLGGGVRYNVVDYGEYDARDINNVDLGVVHPKENYSSLTLGAGATFNEMYYFGAGVSVKPWRFDWGTEGIFTKTAVDLGLIFKADIIKNEGMKLSSSAGIGFLNLGGAIEKNVDLPKVIRYGLGLHFEGPTSRRFEERFGVAVPTCSFTADYELSDDHTRDTFGKATQWGAGTEIGIMQILFLRNGFYRNEYGQRLASFGLGLGLTLKRGWGRIDWASLPYGTKHENMYGISFGSTF